MHKRTTFGIAAMAASALILAGCTSPTGAGSSPNTSGATTSTLSAVLETKKITIGVLADAPPWGVMNSSGEYEGFDIDKAEALAESLGAEVEYVSVTNASRIPMLETDKVDVVIGALTSLDERAQVVAMTRPYAAAGQLVMVPSDSDIESYDDLAGRAVATTRGSVPATILETQFPEAEATLFESVADSIQAIRSNKVDALMESNAVIGEIIRTSGSDFKVVDAPELSPALVSFGVKMGDQLWLNYLDNFIRNYNISARADESYSKWLGTDVPDLLK